MIDHISKERVASSLAWIDDGLCKATATLKRLRHASDYDGGESAHRRRLVLHLPSLANTPLGDATTSGADFTNSLQSSRRIDFIL